MWGPAHSGVEQSVSAIIGPDGGNLALAGADFSMTIPAGALTKPTAITVVARAGTYVVYDMFPHGLRFRRPVTVVQGLSTTAVYRTAKINSVRTAYLRAGSERISARGFAAAAELPAAATYFYGADRIGETHEWILDHFSRYILVSGALQEVPEDDDDNDQGEDRSKVEGIGGGTIPTDSLQAPIGLLEIDP